MFAWFTWNSEPSTKNWICKMNIEWQQQDWWGVTKTVFG